MTSALPPNNGHVTTASACPFRANNGSRRVTSCTLRRPDVGEFTTFAGECKTGQRERREATPRNRCDLKSIRDAFAIRGLVKS